MITSAAWTDAVVEGVIDVDAEQLGIGGWVRGMGAAWLDDFALTIDGAAVVIANPGFEDGTAGWDRDQEGYTFEAVAAAHGGAKALHVAPSVTVITKDLFEEHAAPGEVADVDLGGGLFARVPLAVWSKDGHTLPIADPAPITGALETVRATLDDADARIANLVVAWSAFDQFYPYFDVIGADWPAVLDRTLLDGLDDAGAADHERTLKRLVAALEDGHGSAIVQTDDRAFLPLRLEWAEGQLVVLASAVPELVRGDVIEAIDGVSAAACLDAEMTLVSGSSQWRRVNALRMLGARPKGEPAVLRVARNGSVVERHRPRRHAADGGALAAADCAARRRHLVLRPGARRARRRPGENRGTREGAGRGLRPARLPERHGRCAQPPADEARAGPVDARGAHRAAGATRRAAPQAGLERVSAGTWRPPSRASRARSSSSPAAARSATLSR